MEQGSIASAAARAIQAGKPVAVANLVFAGGFSLGVDAAGWTVAGNLEHVDVGGLGLKTARQKFTVVETNLDGWVTELSQVRGKLPFLFANPPCSAFAGPGRHGGLSDPVMCFLKYALDLALATRPLMWCWELVPSIFTKEPEFINGMASQLAALGYRTSVVLTTASRHGGFQHRERFHFFASKLEIDPHKVIQDQPEEWDGFNPVDVGLREVAELSKRRTLPNHDQHYTGTNIPLLPWTPPGSHLASLPAPLMYRHYRHHGGKWRGEGRPAFTQTRARNGFPCPTIIGGFSVVHPDEDRYLTVREAAHMMGFPPDYEIMQKSPTKAMAEVGKGLTVHTARFIGAIALDAYTSGRAAKPSNRVEDVYDFRTNPVNRKMRMTEDEQKEWQLAKHGSYDPNLVDHGSRHARITDQEEMWENY